VFEFGCSGQCYIWGASPNKCKKANNGEKTKKVLDEMLEKKASMKKGYNKRL
jgi:hypothetical protein